MKDKRRERGEETRKKLLLGVFNLVAEEGLQGLTAGKLSQVAMVSKSTIFHHFASIDQLIIEATRHWFDEQMGALERKQQEYTDVGMYLEALGDAMFEMADNERYFRTTMAFFHKALYDERFRTIFSSFLMEYMLRERQLLASLVGLNVEDQALMEWTALLAATLDGLSMQLAMTKDTALCHAMWKRYTKMFALALANDTTQGDRK